MYLLLHTCWFVPSQGAALFWLGVVDWCMQPFLYYLCLSLNLQASVWSWNQSFMIPLPSISFQAQPRVAGCFHPSLSCRPLDENDLTELPVGIFDSLTLLNFLYVIAQKARCEIPFFFWREKEKEKRGRGEITLAVVVCLIDIILWWQFSPLGNVLCASWAGVNHLLAVLCCCSSLVFRLFFFSLWCDYYVNHDRFFIEHRSIELLLLLG